jgi:signal peptidase I
MRTELLKPLLASLALVALCAVLFVLSGCGKLPTSDRRPPITAWVAVQGQSMLPTFPDGTLVEVEFGIPYDQLKPGDTVIFWDYKRGALLFTHHRLKGKQGPWWIAQGDNPKTNPTADAPFVTAENYYARGTGRHTQILFAPGPL